MDLFVNTFEVLAIYFAVAILDARYLSIENRSLEIASQELPEIQSETTNPEPQITTDETRITDYALQIVRNPLFLLSIGFGVAFGMALACKVNIYPLAIFLPGAFALRYFITDRKNLTVDEGLQTDPPLPLGEGDVSADVLSGEAVSKDQSTAINKYWILVVACLIAGGLAALISFRVFQPYAFDGLLPNKQWIANIQEQRVQATGDADLPWNLQWVRRSHLYSFENLTIWGLGLPLGILAWIGFLYMGWRIFKKGEWRHALLWGWTAAYFLWQSLQFNPTMRYQLPIYPMLAMMAAWVVFNPPQVTHHALRKTYSVIRNLAVVIIVALTAIWAFAFQSIYTRDEPRMAASRWIFQNIPGPINVEIQTGSSTYNQPLPFPTGGFIQAGQPYDTTFIAQSNGTVDSIKLGHAANTLASSSTLSLLLSDTPNPTPEQALATASLTDAFAVNKDTRGDPVTLKLNKPVSVTKGSQYYLRFEINLGTLFINGATLANETDYDYPLPFRLDGYDGFGGIYRGDLNLQVYWDDNQDKLDRFVSTLDQTDYILIPTNHQYAQITRVPERYPLTTLYYRDLIGCPIGHEHHPVLPRCKTGRLSGSSWFRSCRCF